MTVPARPAATVVLVRPIDDGWETYLLRRSAQSPVLADLWVFPGGTLRPDDREASTQQVAPTFSPAEAHAALARPPGEPPASPEESYAYFVAAARELLEEAGIVLSERAPSPAEGEISTATDERTTFGEQRQALERGRSLVEVATELGIRFDLGLLIYYGHWITPEPVQQRFDARFFLAQLPQGQEASPSPFEMAEGLWIDVPGALERSRERTLSLHFATLSHLRRLAPFTTIDELFRFARTKPVVPVMPTIREVNGRPNPHLPDDLVDAW